MIWKIRKHLQGYGKCNNFLVEKIWIFKEIYKLKEKLSDAIRKLEKRIELKKVS